MNTPRSDFRQPQTGADTLEEYLRVVDALGRENGQDPLWWATDAASKNRVRSPLLWLLTPGAHPAQGCGRAGALRTLATEYRRLLARIRQARRLFPLALRPAATGQPVSLVKTFAYPSSFGPAGFSDPFFPGLAEHLHDQLGQGRRVLTVCMDFDDSGEVKQRMADLADPDLLPMEAFLTPADATRAALTILRRLLRPGFHVPSPLSVQGRDVGRDVAQALRPGAGGLPLDQYTHRLAAAAIGQAHNVTHCVLTYEGNPWERMFVFGLRQARPGVEVVGSQHSVVPQAAAGVFPGKAEMELCPLPDRVLTTGQVTADIILRHSHWPASRVLAGCSLRYGALHTLPQAPACGGPVRRVLVAPEGLDEAVDMVGYALRQSRLCPEVRFTIRTHPVLHLDVFLARLGLDLESFPNVERSRLARVDEDLAQCEAVLYWGSTVCMEALMMGVPVIHFDRGDRPSYDPLFEGCTFQWLVDRDTPLAGVLAELAGLTGPERTRRAGQALDYVTRYFHPVTPARLALFSPAAQPGGEARP